MLEMTCFAVQDLNRTTPSDADIWLSIRDKDITNTIRDFLWKCLHQGYKYGTHWRNIPSYTMSSNLYKSNDRSVFGPYLDIETTFLVQPKYRIMEKNPTDHSVVSKYTGAPSSWAKYGKNKQNRIFNLS
jgi:hypothetical protein